MKKKVKTFIVPKLSIDRTEFWHHSGIVLTSTWNVFKHNLAL